MVVQGKNEKWMSCEGWQCTEQVYSGVLVFSTGTVHTVVFAVTSVRVSDYTVISISTEHRYDQCVLDI